MKINLDYNRKIAADSKEKTVSEKDITANYIEYAVNSKYEKGLDGSMRRIWGRIQRKFDVAIDSGSDDIDLDKAEFDFIYKSVEDTKFPPSFSKYVVILEDELDRVKKEYK